MNVYEIPLQPTNQNLKVSILGITYIIRTYYCDIQYGGWVLDISDNLGNPILQGVPLITGNNLLDQYGYLGLGFGLAVVSDGDAMAVPVFNDLGVNGHLYVVTP